MDFLQYIETGNNKTLLIGMFVGVVAYIAKEQENKDEKPIRVLLRIVLGAAMGYFLPERTLTLVSTFFLVKDIALDALMTVLAATLAYGNLDVIKWVYKIIERKADNGKVN